MSDLVISGGASYLSGTADTLDLVTLAEAKAALAGITNANTTWDSELAAYITAVSRRFDELCGPIVVRTITDERHDGSTTSIFLRHPPVFTVTTVTEYSNTTAQVLAAETFAVNTSYDYLLDARLGIIHRRASASGTRFAPTGVKVTYVAGRYATTATVDRQFKLAALITLAHIWRKENGGGSDIRGAEGDTGFLPGFAIPNMALELVKGELRGPTVA